MNRRDLLMFLVLEAVAIAWAGLSFALFSSRLVAGFAAGAYFIGSAAWMFWRIAHWSNRWRSATAYPLFVHLFVISIPMVVTRAVLANRDFTDVRILGLEGPTFHRLSTTVFGVLIAATVLDLVRVTTSKK